jgi:hypothetical protein
MCRDCAEHRLGLPQLCLGEPGERGGKHSKWLINKSPWNQRQRSENPRVGGSIPPPLATTQINISDQEVASGRMDSLSNIGADVQYFGPLFA